MKLFYLLFIALFITACMQTPEVPTSKEVVAKEKIAYNKTEAQQAKDDYLRLQKLRNQE